MSDRLKEALAIAAFAFTVVIIVFTAGVSIGVQIGMKRIHSMEWGCWTLPNNTIHCFKYNKGESK